MRPRPSGSHKFIDNSVKTDAVVMEPEFETNTDENRTLLECEDYADVDQYTELGDMEVEDGYKRFGVAEMNPNHRPNGSHEFLENFVRKETDAVVVESDHDTMRTFLRFKDLCLKVKMLKLMMKRQRTWSLTMRTFLRRKDLNLKLKVKTMKLLLTQSLGQG